MEKIAFITGINGQDGSYLLDFLLDKGYYVYGLARRQENESPSSRQHTYIGDVLDAGTLRHAFKDIKRRHPVHKCFEIYHLAAFSNVKASFEAPEICISTNALGTLKLLEAVQLVLVNERDPNQHAIRFYQASSSEMFGAPSEMMMNENTPLNPVSPYAISKLAAYHIVKHYRNSFNMFACNGILFNHESPRRRVEFLSRKITSTLAKILSNSADHLEIGNLEAARDWGHARDYVRGMWMMLQANEPDDYILATSHSHTVREFIESAFLLRGMHLRWEGEGVETVGKCAVDGRVVVKVNPFFFRPYEPLVSCGDFSKARKLLGWFPETTFSDLVKEMVEADCPALATHDDD